MLWNHFKDNTKNGKYHKIYNLQPFTMQCIILFVTKTM